MFQFVLGLCSGVVCRVWGFRKEPQGTGYEEGDTSSPLGVCLGYTEIFFEFLSKNAEFYGFLLWKTTCGQRVKLTPWSWRCRMHGVENLVGVQAPNQLAPWSWVNKIGDRKLQFTDRLLQISDSIIGTKSIKDFHLEFSYWMCSKIVWNLLMQYSCLHKEIMFQNALRYNFVLLSAVRFSQFEGENSLPVDAFCKNILQQEDNFQTC